MQDQTDDKIRSIFAESLGMHYDSANKVLCGKRDGFDVILYESDGRVSYSFSALVSAAKPMGERLTAAEMQELKNNFKKLDDWSFTLSCYQEGHDIIVPNLVATGVGQLPRTEDSAKRLDCLCSFLKSKGCRPCCSQCGQEMKVSPFRLGESYQHLCLACEADTRSRLAAQKQRRKENVVLGFVGALLGALPGMAVIVWGSQSEFFLEMVLIGAIVAFCIMKGYELLGGGLTKKAVVIGSVVMLSMIYVANRFEWAIQIYTKGRFGLSFEQCFIRIPLLISNGVIDLKEYITELAALYLLLLLGAVPGAACVFGMKESRECFVRLG